MGNIDRRTFVAGGLAATALTTLTSCFLKKSDSAANNKVLKYFITNPAAIDPYDTKETSGTQVEQAMFDGLTGFDWATAKIVPKAAESWEVNDDATVFTFHLVPGAKFHNGDPVDAASFKRGFQRICDPNMKPVSTISYHLDPIKGAKEMCEGKAEEISGIEVVDDNTLKISLVAPMADFPSVCAHSALVPVPQAALDDPDSFLEAPIGNGAFKIDGKWVNDRYIYLVRFDEYYGEKAKIDGIYFSIQKDPATAFREYEAGNIDFVDIPTGRIAEVERSCGESEDGFTSTPGKQVLKGVEAGMYWLTVNLEDELMKDLTIRQAISLAINRQNIVDTVFEGTRTPADCVIPRVIDSDEGNAWEYCRYDVDAAKRLLDEKYPADERGKRGIKITLSYNTGGGHEDVMSCIQGDLEAVGIEATQSSLEWAAYLQAMSDGTYQIGRMGWTADYPTMDNFIYPSFLTTSENNYSKYKNPALDEGLVEARKIVDDEARKVAYRKLNAMLGDDLPVIPIMFYSHNNLASERVAKLYYDPQALTDFRHVEMV